ncbi:MAG TPA: hypothetical protein VIG64_07580, partial [Actinomycetota bacterium]
RAFSTGTGLIITARGTMPESCWDVSITRNLLQVDPPEFVLERCRTAPVCPVVTPYSTSAEFDFGGDVGRVVLHHSENGNPVTTELTVEPIPTTLATSVEARNADEATGMSLAFSYEEALAHALDQLDAGDSSVLVEASVESVKASKGGIVAPYIAVTVKRVPLD